MIRLISWFLSVLLLLLLNIQPLQAQKNSSFQSPVQLYESGYEDITIYKAPINNLFVFQGELGDWGHESTSEDLLKKHESFFLATNAGMFKENDKHAGMLKLDNEMLSPITHYSSFLCLAPFHDEKPGILNDLKGHGMYKTVVQNLASIKDGKNTWEGGRNKFGSIVLATRPNDPEWVYFIIATQARSGKALADILIELGFDNAQHLEGGPEAQLSIRTQDKKKVVIKNHQACYEGGVHASYDCGSLVDVPWFLVVKTNN